MNELSYLQAAVLGVVQGLTEFLPISSSGHLAMVQEWFGLDPSASSILLFDMMSHIGTTVAMLAVFYKPLMTYLRSLLACPNPWAGGRLTAASDELAFPIDLPPASIHRQIPCARKANVAWRVTWLALAATIVTGVIGVTFKDWFESTFADRGLLALGFFASGIMLAATPFAPRGRRGWRQIGWHHAALIGLAQAISIIPSISRSGATICTALFLGIRRKWAAEFSFLIAVPAILGATLIKLKDSFEIMREGGILPWGSILFGSVVAGAVGLFALLALLHILRLSKLHYFAPYCLIVGVLVLLGIM